MHNAQRTMHNAQHYLPAETVCGAARPTRTTGHSKRVAQTYLYVDLFACQTSALRLRSFILCFVFGVRCLVLVPNHEPVK